jgi:mRNA interferase MazF
VVSQVSVVANAELVERLGMLSPQRVDQVLAGLRFQQRSFEVWASARGYGVVPR